MNDTDNHSLYQSGRKMALFALLIVSHSAFATDGTVTFNSVLTAPTCTINQGTSPNFNVPMPNVGTNQLETAGQVAGATPFSISLSGCGSSPRTLTTYFSGLSNIDASTGNLKTTGTAANVEIQLSNAGDGSVINLNGASGSQGVTPSNTSVSGTGSFDYIAQYYALGGALGAIAGTVNSVVNYTIIYP